MYHLDLFTSKEMSRSSVTSSQRTSLNCNEESNILPSCEHTNKHHIADQQIISSSTVNTENSPTIRLGTVIEDDDDGKGTTASVTHSADFFRWTRGHRRVMLTFGTICLFAFMTGVEYAVILPTAFDYVKSMTNINIYVGLILSSYSISGSITGVIMGKLTDTTGKVKILILLSSIFE